MKVPRPPALFRLSTTAPPAPKEKRFGDFGPKAEHLSMVFYGDGQVDLAHSPIQNRLKTRFRIAPPHFRVSAVFSALAASGHKTGGTSGECSFHGKTIRLWHSFAAGFSCGNRPIPQRRASHRTANHPAAVKEPRIWLKLSIPSAPGRELLDARETAIVGDDEQCHFLRRERQTERRSRGGERSGFSPPFSYRQPAKAQSAYQLTSPTPTLVCSIRKRWLRPSGRIRSV